MVGPSQAMVELHDRALACLRDDACRLIHVVTKATSRRAALETLRGLELSPFAPGPFVELSAPHDTGAPGWDVRADALRRAYEARREVGEAEPWPELPPRPTAGGLAGFAAQLGQALGCTPGRRPWVVILAPTHVGLISHWARAVAMLLDGSELGAVRWVVVDVDEPTLGDEVGGGGERARIDVQEAGGALLGFGLVAASESSAGSGVDGPPRPRQAPKVEPTSEERRQQELAGLVTCAARAHQEGRGVEAIEQQRLARDLCAEQGWREQQATMELLLGSYLLGASSPEHAEARNREAVALARGVRTRPELLPAAQLAQGSTRMTRGDRPGALLAYSDALISADERGTTTLQLEACRLAGDTALLLGMEAQAIAFWSKAVAVAEARPELAALSSAGHCARATALLCERRGLTREAVRYWEAARGLEVVDLHSLLAPEEPALVEEELPAPLPEVVTEAVRPTDEPRDDVPPPKLSIHRSGSTLPLVDLGSTTDEEVFDGTAAVTVEEIAVLHWNGVVPSDVPSTIVHEWQPEEEKSLRRASMLAMTPEATALMTKQELAAIHGHSALAPAKEAEPEATAILEQAVALERVKATDPEADGTAWISQDKLAQIRARLGAPDYDVPPPAPRPEPVTRRPRVLLPSPPETTIDPMDETAVMTRERALELARKYAASQRSREDEAD